MFPVDLRVLSIFLAALHFGEVFNILSVVLTQINNYFWSFSSDAKEIQHSRCLSGEDPPVTTVPLGSLVFAKCHQDFWDCFTCCITHIFDVPIKQGEYEMPNNLSGRDESGGQQGVLEKNGCFFLSPADDNLVLTASILRKHFVLGLLQCHQWIQKAALKGICP